MFSTYCVRSLRAICLRQLNSCWHMSSADIQKSATGISFSTWCKTFPPSTITICQSTIYSGRQIRVSNIDQCHFSNFPFNSRGMSCVGRKIVLAGELLGEYVRGECPTLVGIHPRYRQHFPVGRSTRARPETEKAGSCLVHAVKFVTWMTLASGSDSVTTAVMFSRNVDQQ